MVRGVNGVYSGQRQGDTLKMRWSDVRKGVMAVEQEKTGKKLWIPIHAELKKILSEVPCRGEFILMNGRGEGWAVDGFKTAWQRQMADEALKPLREQKCVFHGLSGSQLS